MYCFRRIYIPHCVHHYFWPKILQDQTRCLLKFIFISLTSCDAFQSFYLFIYYYYYLCGPLIGLSGKKLCSTPNPKLEVTHFYIISQECAKPCKVFNLHLHLNGSTQHNMNLHQLFFFQFFYVEFFVTLPPKLENLVKITLKRPKFQV
jgi:hypothetical protein